MTAAEEEALMAVRLGECIATLRKAKGMSQAELSARTALDGDIPINKPNIARLESGRRGGLPLTRTLVRLARALDCTVTELCAPIDSVLLKPEKEDA